MSCQSCLDLNPHFNQVQKTCPDHADLRFCPGCKSPVHHAKFNKNQVRCGPCLARGKFGASRECVYDDTKHDAPLEDFGLRMKTCRPCLKSTFCDACRPGFTCPRHAGRRVCVECNTAKPAFAFIGAKRVCKGCELFKREHPTDEPEVVENPDLHRCQGPCQKEKVNTDFDKDLQVCRVCLDLGCEPCILLNRFDSARTKTMTCSECQNEGLSFCKARIHCVDSESFARHGECHACSLALQRLRGSDIAEKDPLFKRQMILDNIASKKVFDRDARRTCNVCNLEKSAQQYEKGRSTCDKCRRQAYKERCQAAERPEQQTCRLCKIEKTIDQFHTGCGNVPESRCKSCRRQLTTTRLSTEDVVKQAGSSIKTCVDCHEVLDVNLKNFAIHTNSFRNQCRSCHRVQSITTNARNRGQTLVAAMVEDIRHRVHLPCYFCNITPCENENTLNTVISGTDELILHPESMLTSCSLCAKMLKRMTAEEFIENAARISEYGPVGSEVEIKGPILREAAIEKNAHNIPLWRKQQLWRSDCTFCGRYLALGIDRIDSRQDYTEGNIQSCCYNCNASKSDLDQNLFLQQCRRITHNRSLCAQSKDSPGPIRSKNQILLFYPRKWLLSSELVQMILVIRSSSSLSVTLHWATRAISGQLDTVFCTEVCHGCKAWYNSDRLRDGLCSCCQKSVPTTEVPTKLCNKCTEARAITDFSGRNAQCNQCRASALREKRSLAQQANKRQKLESTRTCAICPFTAKITEFQGRKVCPKCRSRQVMARTTFE